MKDEYSHIGILFKTASGVGLSDNDRECVADGANRLAAVRASIRSGEINPFVGLGLRDKLSLLSYLAFMKENAFTDTSAGHTPITDSARRLITDSSLYRSDEAGLTYDLAAALNKMPYLLGVMISIDSDGCACVVR